MEGGVENRVSTCVGAIARVHGRRFVLTAEVSHEFNLREHPIVN